MPGEQSISINNEEHTRLRNALRESELLRELSELLASSLDPTHILQVLVRRTTEVCEVQRCAVWLLDESQAFFHPSAYHFNASHLTPKALQVADHVWHRSRFPFDDHIIQHLVRNQFCLTVTDLPNTPSPHMRLLADKFLVRSILLIALMREGKPVGIMSLDNPEQDTIFSTEQQQLARAIGQQAALTIHNARLYQQAQNERKRAERLIHRAQSINQVATAVNSGEELPVVLRIAAQQLKQGSEPMEAAITILDQGTLTLQALTYHDQTITPHEQAAFLLPTLPHCQQVADTGNILFVSRGQADPDEQSWFHNLGLEQVLIVPLMGGTRSQSSRHTERGQTRCLGLAFVGFPRQARPPSRGFRAYTLDIAAQCALAIERSQILEEVRQTASLATERANTLDAIFNAMSEGVLVLDMQGKAILSNNTARRILEFPFGTPIHLSSLTRNRHISNLRGKPIPPDRFPIARALKGEYIRGERYITNTLEGSERIIEVNVAPLQDASQQQIGIVSAFRDVSEQARGERRVRRALDTMLHAAEAISGITDLHPMLHSLLTKMLITLHCDRGMVQLYNQEQQRFEPFISIGFAPEEIEPWHQEQQIWLTPGEGQYTGFSEQLLTGHALQISGEQCPDNPNPFLQTMLLAAPIMHNTNLQGVVLLDRSTTLRKEQDTKEETTRPLRNPIFNVWDLATAEGIARFAGLAMEQMRWQEEAANARANEELMRQSNNLKDEFLDITAHEFRTPLTIIVAHSQMMERALRKHPQLDAVLQRKLDESIAIIDHQAHQLTNIVNTFLEVTRLNRGQIELHTEELDLERIIEQAVNTQAATTSKHTISCHIQHTSLPYQLLGDEARLSQVFANLLQNAIKYSPFGGPITITLEQQRNERGDPLVLARIQDKGIGIPPDALAHLFERFYRAPNSDSGNRGVGLGLYVVAQFLHLHGGTIHVESSGVPGEGSSFILTLPLLERSDAIHE
ncbi:ATP-binding protein [Ktedonospora formicarum]|uniref:histidine kinase n=1 Tax=Ktedonospora formicarum TaxID=2778364 RepID=A0A8J3MYU9_9CHLR|nr:ATP-binding protein [Ktedonospora formicarum]GHO50060.1 hypothetical protein KSX_82230 [Ktedonospora formicarum]